MTCTLSGFTAVLWLFVFQMSVLANSNQTSAPDKIENSVILKQILSSMNEAAKNLRSAQAELSYLTIEDPDLLNTKVLRTGILYYLKDDERSHLRIHFRDLKQDDFDPESRREEYLFDGVWLTRVDYKLKQVDSFQQAPEEEPVDVFQLISHNFPLVGFTDSNSINKDFVVSLAPEQEKGTVCLLLTTKQGSPFAKEYKNIDLWVDKSTFLPSRIRAFSVQGDIHDISFKGLEVNKNLKKAVFTIEKPSGFRENIEPLKSTRK